MIHRVSKRKVLRDTNARKALLKNLANELILHERITTTQARAKSLRPFLEKLVTKSKNNTLSTRRLLISRLGLQNAVGKLLDVIGPIFKERPGGYTRIIKLPSRTGDNAEMAVIEFVENVSEIAAKKKLEKPKKEEKTKIEVKEKQKTKKIVKKKKEVKPKEKTKK